MIRCDDTIMRILTIDQGNTSAKAVVWEDGEPVASLKSKDLIIEELLPLMENGEFDGCAYCSVRHTDAKFLETLRRLVDGNLMVLTPSVSLPMLVHYGTRATLGNDRVAAVAGAISIFPSESLLVVDSGTAMTIDVTDAAGNFMGGNISPGIQMRFSSLHQLTDQLPLVDDEGEVAAFGSDTVSAIRSGVVGGMVSEIADCFEHAHALYGCSRIVIAGKDDRKLCQMLRERGLKIVAEPNLVGRGLLAIYMYNLNSGNL
ncbi:MAG: type III pantothenate kinase [Bacteroides sp.]|nr:type III pantothenate kinase [Bacteroides sp.]